MKKNKKVLITGSNGGIGLSTIECFLKQGQSNLICHYRSDGQELSSLLRRYDLDPEKHMYKAELTSDDEVQKMRDQIEKDHGALWGLVNLAGATTNGMSWKLTTEDFRKVIDANLLSTFLCTREFLPGMRAAAEGRIVNVSSVVAHMGVVGAAHYAAAKAGIEGFTRSVALEVANKNISVNSLALGYFEYGMLHQISEPILEGIKSTIPQRRWGNASDVHGILSYLLSPQSTFVTGQVIHLNGGQRL